MPHWSGTSGQLSTGALFSFTVLTGTRKESGGDTPNTLELETASWAQVVATTSGLPALDGRQPKQDPCPHGGDDLGIKKQKGGHRSPFRKFALGT